MSKFLDSNGLLYFWQKVKALAATKVTAEEGKGLSTNDYTDGEKTKLGGIAAGANAYTHPTTSGNKHVPSGGASGNILRWSADGTAVWGADTNTTYSPATASANGLMSSTDKSKLDGVAAGANNYTHPAYTARTAGLNKVTVDASGHVSAVTAVTKADITGLGIPAQDTTYGAMAAATSEAAGGSGLVPAPAAGKHLSYLRGDGAWAVPTNTTYSAATTGAAGLMSAADKSKLDGVAAGANAYTHPTSDGNKHVPATGTTNSGKFLRAGSTAGSAAWGALAQADVTGALGYTPPEQDTTYDAATTGAAGLMSAADKTKLDGVAAGANNYTHPAYTAKASGLYKVTVDASGHVSAAAAVVKSDITALGIPGSNTTYGNMSGASSSTAGTAGLVPAPAAGKQASFLRGDGTWVVPTNTTYAVATASANGLMSKADKSKLDGFGAASTYALKSDITNMYRYKGSVAAVANLPATGNTAGDVYDVQADGMNYAWNGTTWDQLGGTFTVEAITNAEIDAIVAA